MTTVEMALKAVEIAVAIAKSLGATEEQLGDVIAAADKEVDAIDRAEQEARTREQEAARGFVG